MGGVLVALALAALLFWFWRKRHQRAKAAVRTARADAKVRAATAEKFHPGANKAKLLGDADTEEALKSRSLGNRSTSPHSSGRDGQEEDEEGMNEEDVEWTVLREDGLTAFSGRLGQDDTLEQDMAALKRRSIGAATHLSRITEGAEDEDESEARQRARYPVTLTEGVELGSQVRDGHTRGHSSSASIGSDLNRARSRKSPIGRGSNPFWDSSEVASVVSGISSTTFPGSTEGSTAMCSSALEHSNWSAPTSLEAPSRVHRPVGAPLVDLQGKPKTAFANLSAPNSAGSRSPLSPTSPAHPTAPPNRPLRKPDLNLRLADGSEPGKIGDDLRKPLRSATALSNEGDAGPMLSPSSAHFDSDGRDKTLEEMETDDFPTELAKSSGYSKRFYPRSEKRSSTMTTNSVSTVGTLEYVMSSPQIVTPMEADAAKRMQLKQGKAHLVRSLSAVRREQEEQKARRRAQGLTDAASNTGSDGNSQSEDPFSDVNGTATPTTRSVSPANTFGQRYAGEGASEISVPLGIPAGVDTSSLPPFAQRALALAGHNFDSGSARPQSSMSSASLPFVDRPMREPTDRSPTDAQARESIATLGSNKFVPRFRPSMSSELDARTAMHRGSSLSVGSAEHSFGHDGKGQRQSQASIGGLSVFDEIPFHIGHDETEDHIEISMPDDAQTKIQEAKQRITSGSSAHTMEILPFSSASSVRSPTSSMAMSPSPLFHTLAEDARPFEGAAEPKSSPFHDDNAASDAETEVMDDDRNARRMSVPTSMDNADGLRMHDDHGQAEGREAQMRANAEFDQIRLRHELDNYPFEIAAQR